MAIDNTFDTRFDRTAAAAAVAAAAYRPARTRFVVATSGRVDLRVVEMLKPERVTDAKYVVADGSAAIVLPVPARGVVWVGVRGTDQLSDFWQFNGRCRPVEWLAGRVHSGFHAYATQLRAGVARELAAIQEERGPLGVIVCGHSLGAAAGAILAAEFNAVRFYGFGMPRVFDRVAAREFRRRVDYCERWVDGADPVCRVPRLRYVHPCRAHYRASDGRVHIGPGRLFQFVDRCRGRVVRVGRAARELANAAVAIDQHGIKSYRAAVDAARNVDGGEYDGE